MTAEEYAKRIASLKLKGTICMIILFLMAWLAITLT